MPMFPFATSDKILAFDVVSEGNNPLKPMSLKLEALRNALEPKLRVSRVPPSLDTLVTEIWGWHYLDNVGPISVDRYLAWGILFWRKNVPNALVQSIAEERIKEWQIAHTDYSPPDGKPITVAKCPAEVRKDLKAQVRDEIVSRTPPNITENVVLYDCKLNRLYLFNCGGNVLSQRCASVALVLAEAFGLKSLPTLTPRTTANWFGVTRASSVLPSGVDERYLSWMAAVGMDAKSFAINHDEGTSYLSIVMGNDVHVRSGDNGKIRIEGRKAVEDWFEDDANAAHPVTRGKFSVSYTPARSPETYKFILDIDTEGLRGVRIEHEVPSFAATEWEEATIARADDYEAAVKAWELTLLIFDNTALAQMMQEEPQAPLWPHLPNAVITESVDEPRSLTPIEREIRDRGGK